MSDQKQNLEEEKVRLQKEQNELQKKKNSHLHDIGTMLGLLFLAMALGNCVSQCAYSSIENELEDISHELRKHRLNSGEY